jgi:hypothetical protein
MTENLLETTEPSNNDSAPDSAPDTTTGADTTAQPPEGLPEKFWDGETGQIRTDNLVKSYQALEQKLGGLTGRVTPDGPDGYEIKSDNELFTSDPDVNARLHGAGFSQEQAQTVYDLASEYLSPMVTDVAAEFHTQTQVDRLSRKFGGEDKWNQTAQQIKSWGSAKFPAEVFQALSGTYDGVLAMHRMMSEDGNEPGLMENAGATGEGLSEASLKQSMQDPRYWRDHDPAFVAKVHDGFKRLFPSQT